MKTNLLLIILLLIAVTISCNRVQNTMSHEKIKIDSLSKFDCDILLQELKAAKADTFGKINRTPVDIEDCLLQLDSITSDKMKEWIRCLPDGEFSSWVNSGYTLYLRSNWGFWGNSALTHSFVKMGIIRPSDMNNILLNSFQRKLKGQDIKLKEQIIYFQYWKQGWNPNDTTLYDFKNEGC